MSSGISQSAHVSNEHCSAHFRISNILMRNEMFGLKSESYLFLRICWPSGGCSQHISIVCISPLREQIGIHASLLLLWEQRPKVGAVKEVLLASLEPLCPKTFPPLFSLLCVPDTCLEKDSLRHAGSLTEFSCIQEKKIQARQPLKSWRRIYTDTQVGHICEAHILVWGADRGESLETWKLVAQMQTLRWQKKVSRKYCLVIQLLKILSCHPTFENIVTSSKFWQYCHVIHLLKILSPHPTFCSCLAILSQTGSAPCDT